MPSTPIIPAISMTAVFALYTTVVWIQRRHGTIEPWHVVAVWVALAVDIGGTLHMSTLAGRGASISPLHTAIGLVGIGVLAAHATWMTALRLRPGRSTAAFTHWGVTMWALWMAPYLGGMFAGMLVGG